MSGCGRADQRLFPVNFGDFRSFSVNSAFFFKKIVRQELTRNNFPEATGCWTLKRRERRAPEMNGRAGPPMNLRFTVLADGHHARHPPMARLRRDRGCLRSMQFGAGQADQQRSVKYQQKPVEGTGGRPTCVRPPTTRAGSRTEEKQ